MPSGFYKVCVGLAGAKILGKIVIVPGYNRNIEEVKDRVWL